MTTKRVLCSNKVDFPKILSPNDKVYPNHTGTHVYKQPENGGLWTGVKNTVTLELTEWPHLTATALDNYEQAVINEGEYHQFSTAGTHPVLTHPNHSLSYLFPENESPVFQGFDVSFGNRALTFYPRKQGGNYGMIAASFQKHIRAKVLPGSSSKLTEDDPRHVWIHPQGLTTHQHLTNHWHLLWVSGQKISSQDIQNVIAAAVEKGVIHPPGLRSKIDPSSNNRLIRNPAMTNEVRIKYEKKLILRREVVLST